ncbi:MULTISPECIES: hypothetical protein [Streptomyces]|uniref:Uncharacterized protein n=2 Tax=Streptomyces TaxID=1883 RepID=A0ABU4JZ44_9ACTN|nr:hypothetical protein [Streptomyces roseolus]MDX2290708.1 hypothetical protein [Streptomyces roseolus]
MEKADTQVLCGELRSGKAEEVSERFNLAREALSRFGELRWIRLSGGRHPLYGYQQVPFLGWRFTQPDEERLRAIEDARKATPTRYEWRIDTSRRNWILAPSRLLGEVGEHAASPEFDERVNQLMQDQEFCLRALEDLDAILRSLLKQGLG